MSNFKIWSHIGSVDDLISALPDQLEEGFGSVYVIEFSDDVAKIGSSSKPTQRIKNLRSSFRIYGDRKISRVAVSQFHIDYHETERELHRLFSDYRQEGELFNVSIDQVEEALSKILMLDQSEMLAIIESNDPFPIGFDDAWKWIGYTRKDNAKRKLTSNFTKDVDYQSITHKEKLGTGATHREIVKLTVDCFKSFCMMAETEKGREVRQYFLKCERIAKARFVPPPAKVIYYEDDLVEKLTSFTRYSKMGLNVDEIATLLKMEPAKVEHCLLALDIIPILPVLPKVEPKIRKKVEESEDMLRFCYNVTLVEMRIFIKLMTMIEEDDEDSKIYRIYITDFMADLQTKNNSLYINIKRAIERLPKRVFTIQNPDGSASHVAFVDKAYYGEGLGYFELSPNLGFKSYLLCLKKLLSQQDIVNILKFKSTYSIRFYEFLKQAKRKKEQILAIAKLRAALKLEGKYQLYTGFKQRIIKPVQKEFHCYNALKFKFEEVKTSRKVTHLAIKTIH